MLDPVILLVIIYESLKGESRRLVFLLTKNINGQ